MPFGDGACFSNCIFNKNAFFSNSTFNGKSNFKDSQFSGNFNFMATFADELDLSGIKFNNININWDSVKDHIVSDRTGYIALIKYFEDKEDFGAVDDCYYKYRNWRLSTEPLGLNKITDFILLISCGYGVRPSYTLIISSILIILFGYLYIILNAIYKPKKSIRSLSPRAKQTQVGIHDALYFSAMIFFVSHPPTDWRHIEKWRFLIMIEDIMGWVLMTLFVVALGHVLIR